MTATMFYAQICKTDTNLLKNGKETFCSIAKNIAKHYTKNMKDAYPSLDNVNKVIGEYSNLLKQSCNEKLGSKPIVELLTSFIVRLPYNSVSNEAIPNELTNEMKKHSYLYSKPRRLHTWFKISELATKKSQEKVKCGCGCSCKSFFPSWLV